MPRVVFKEPIPTHPQAAIAHATSQSFSTATVSGSTRRGPNATHSSSDSSELGPFTRAQLASLAPSAAPVSAPAKDVTSANASSSRDLPIEVRNEADIRDQRALESLAVGRRKASKRRVPQDQQELDDDDDPEGELGSSDGGDDERRKSSSKSASDQHKELGHIGFDLEEYENRRSRSNRGRNSRYTDATDSPDRGESDDDSESQNKAAVEQHKHSDADKQKPGASRLQSSGAQTPKGVPPSALSSSSQIGSSRIQATGIHDDSGMLLANQSSSSMPRTPFQKPISPLLQVYQANPTQRTTPFSVKPFESQVSPSTGLPSAMSEAASQSPSSMVSMPLPTATTDCVDWNILGSHIHKAVDQRDMCLVTPLTSA